ncbi:MAG TPA: hypothetical protein DCF33_13190 [Saprospirales bacterium]|nr:hypothetical protein [Saprospirales bacterium]
MGIIKPIGALDRGIHKDQVIALGEADAQAVIDSGQYDLLKVYIEMKRYELYLKAAMDKIRETAMAVAQETGMKSFNYADAQVTNMQRRVFHFDKDPTWCRLHDAFEFQKNRLKEHEEILKHVDSENSSYIDEETGELIELVPPTMEVVESIIVKL